MTEECNCLPLKQILNCPFETSESMLFFQNFVRTGFTAQEAYWPALESLGERAGRPGVPFQWLHTDGLSPWSKLFPSLPSTQDFVWESPPCILLQGFANMAGAAVVSPALCSGDVALSSQARSPGFPSGRPAPCQQCKMTSVSLSWAQGLGVAVCADHFALLGKIHDCL